MKKHVYNQQGREYRIETFKSKSLSAIVVARLFFLFMAGGRPPIYNAESEADVAVVENLCKSYFEQLESEPPLVTGLTLHLGFENKSTLYDYAKKPEFSNPIKRALTRIEMFHEKATASGDKCTGNIFVLKNFDWHDTVKQDLDVNIKPVEFNVIGKNG